MKKISLLTLMVLFLLSTTMIVSAEERVEKKIEFKNQTHCPVMGGKIDSTSYTDIQGQRVYHCCPMCSKKLKDDPDTYFKKSAEQGVLFENIQTTCPVSGEKLAEKKSSIYFEGRTIYFCCDDCIGPYKKDAQKFLKALNDTPQEKKTVTKQHDHSGHNH